MVTSFQDQEENHYVLLNSEKIRNEYAQYPIVEDEDGQQYALLGTDPNWPTPSRRMENKQ